MTRYVGDPESPRPTAGVVQDERRQAVEAYRARVLALLEARGDEEAAAEVRALEVAG